MSPFIAFCQNSLLNRGVISFVIIVDYLEASYQISRPLTDQECSGKCSDYLHTWSIMGLQAEMLSVDFTRP
jgi:hypothetical protein